MRAPAAPRARAFGVLAAGLLIAVVSPACNGGDDADPSGDGSASGAGECRISVPEFAAGADRATVEAGAVSRVAVGAAARDPSLTLVGFCLPSSQFPDPAPTVHAGSRVLHPIGGELVKTSAGWRNYYIYPPTERRDLIVERSGSRLASLAFEAQPSGSCDLRADAPFRVLSCGSIVMLEWSSRLPFAADDVSLLDVNALDGGDPRRQLNFYDLGYRDGPRGLRVRFGIRRPRTGRVQLQVNLAYVRRGGKVAELPLRQEVSFRLRGAGAAGAGPAGR